MAERKPDNQSTEAPVGEGEVGENEGDDYSLFMQDDDDDLDVDDSQEVKKTDTKSEGQEAEQEEGEEKKEEVKTEEKEKEGETKKEEEEPKKEEKEEKPTEQQAQQLSPEEAQQHYQQWRDRAISELAEQWKLTDEQVTEFEQDPGSFLPKFAAGLYVDAITTAVQRVMQAMPQAVDAHLSQKESSSKNEEKFFEKWPQLREHKDQVMQFARMYRQMNPNASMEEMINNVGAQVSIATGAVPQQQQNQPQQPPNNLPNGEQPHFKPAGSRTTSPGKPSPDNPFTALDEELFGVEDMDLG